MDLFRWILLLIGLAILIAIYFTGQKRDNTLRPKKRDKRKHQEPQLDDTSLDEALQNIDQKLAGQQAEVVKPQPKPTPAPGSKMPGADDSAPRPAAPRPTAPQPAHSEGGLTLDDLGLELFDESRAKQVKLPDGVEDKIVSLHIAAPPGQMFYGEDLLAIFKARGFRYGRMRIFHAIDDNQILYSVANMVEPGFFDLKSLLNLKTPGISLFMRLPGPLPAAAAFDAMLNEVTTLSQELKGQLQDDRHSTLTNQRVSHIQDELRDYSHKLKLKLSGGE